MEQAIIKSNARRWPWGLLLVALPVCLVLWLVVWPILIAVFQTFHVEGPNGAEWSVKSYKFFFTDAYSLNNLWLTLWTTALTGALLLVISLPIAIYLRFATGRLAAVVQSLAVFPLFVPSIILAYALIRAIGPNGALDTVLHALGLPKMPSPYLTPWGPIIGLTWDNLPLTVLILMSGLGNVSNAAIEAARDVGAGRFVILKDIILPRIVTALLVALSFDVLGIFSAFTFPYILGPASPEMMGPYMQRTFSDLNDPVSAQTQAVVSFLFCAIFGLFYVRQIAKGRSAGTS
jgi:ABC-type spermidine/putrescine transport system permease subunit I